MTNEQVIRQSEIRLLRKDILKLKDGTIKGYMKMNTAIDNLYFDSKITENEHTDMKEWIKVLS